MLLIGTSISSIQAAPPATELTLFDFLGAMVEDEDGWVDPLDLLDEPVIQGLDKNAGNAGEEAAASTTNTQAPDTPPVNEEEMQP